MNVPRLRATWLGCFRRPIEEWSLTVRSSVTRFLKRVVGGDRGATDDEDRGADSTLAQTCVELGEQIGGLLGGELVSGPRHAVTRSRAGT